MKRTSELLDKAPPACLDSERAVLACVLLHPGRFAEVAAALSPNDFYDDVHRVIYAAMSRLNAAGTPPDCTLVVAALRDSGRYNADDGPSAFTILSLYKMFPLVCHLTHYIARVKEMARRRHGFDRGIKAIQAAHNYEPKGPALPPAALQRAARRHRG